VGDDDEFPFTGEHYLEDSAVCGVEVKASSSLRVSTADFPAVREEPIKVGPIRR
jgi:hypothetical protein